MNWYKKAYNNVYLYAESCNDMRSIKKEGGVKTSVLIALLMPLLSWLGWTKFDIGNLLTKNNHNTQSTIKQVIEIAKTKNAPTQLIEQTQKNITSIEQDQPIISTVQQTKPTQFDFNVFRNRLHGFEGYTTQANPVGNKGEIDISMGHVMYNPNNPNPTERSRKIFIQLFGNKVNFDNVLSGKSSLTTEQANQLANYEIHQHLIRAKNIFPQFDNYPQYVQNALLDSVYRGDMTPKVSTLVNSGQWDKAAKEYINRQDYRNAEHMNIRGIIPRMNRNKNAFLAYAKETQKITQY